MPIRMPGESAFKDRFARIPQKDSAQRINLAREAAALALASPATLAAGRVKTPTAEQAQEAVLSTGVLERASKQLRPSWARKVDRPPSETMQVAAEQPEAETQPEEPGRNRDQAVAELAQRWANYNDEQLDGISEAISQIQNDRWEAEAQGEQAQWNAEMTGEVEPDQAEEYEATQAGLAEQAELQYYQDAPADDLSWLEEQDEELAYNEDNEEVNDDGE